MESETKAGRKTRQQNKTSHGWWWWWWWEGGTATSESLQVWFIPGIFSGSQSGYAAETECEHIRAEPELSAECVASAMFISHSFSVSLLGSHCLSISVQRILALSLSKTSSDSDMRRGFHLGSQIWWQNLFIPYKHTQFLSDICFTTCFVFCSLSMFCLLRHSTSSTVHVATTCFSFLWLMRC